MIYVGLFYQAGEGDDIMESDVIQYITFFAVLILSIIFSMNFFKKIWVEILKVAAANNARLFRYMTCGRKDMTEFRADYMDWYNEKNEDEHDLD